METAQPLVFEPLFMERVWGGRRLEALYGKRLPPTVRIGESWEIVDREEAQSVVHEGPLRGLTLHDLWVHHREDIFGDGWPETARFPLLFKLLDAQDRLSVQVHPPAGVAAALGGEPKTEMWYILEALLESDLYAGVEPGVTCETFEKALSEGRVAELIHHLPSQTGAAIFIPSGRIHAIGAGNVVFEVQQNSDTTYRVFDWNRLGLDGQPRALQVAESMRAIDFADVEPRLAQPEGEVVVSCAFFRLEKWPLEEARRCESGNAAVFCVVAGRLTCGECTFSKGEFFIVPASSAKMELRPIEPGTSVLRTTIPS